MMSFNENSSANERENQLKFALNICVAKTRCNLPDMVRQPTTWALATDGDYAKWNESFFSIGNWTNGFFAGMGMLSYFATGDPFFLHQLEALEPRFQAKLTGVNAKNTMHDLGFLYSPYAVALYNLTGDNKWQNLALKAAKVLTERFIENGGYFRAWGRMDQYGTEYEGLAIIDCLMNLPLLYWASETSGDAIYRTMAERHADVTLANFVRADGSIYHSYRFDVMTGVPDRPDNYCGHHLESHWARGSAWAMYGFALSYRHTGEKRYLDAAVQITRKLIACLDDEIVPLWDFRLTPLAPSIRDSSAAAVATCAIIELERLGASDSFISNTKIRLLNRLISPDYFDADMSVRGILKKSEIGDGSDEDRLYYQAKYAYTSWGDYFLTEALSRELGQSVNWW